MTAYPFCTLQCALCKKYKGYTDRPYNDGAQTVCPSCTKKDRRVNNFYGLGVSILASAMDLSALTPAEREAFKKGPRR